MQISIAAYVVLFGLMAGSFVNLAADRVPRGESVITPGSHCRQCGRRLNAIDLLPVAGYLLRRGRCATCGTSIGVSSPLIEATCGVLVAVPVIWLGLWPGALAGLLLLALYGGGVVSVAMRRRRPAEASAGDVNL